MIPALVHPHGLGLGGLVSSLVHGFAWSVGWMLAKGLGLPVAAVVLVAVALVLYVAGRRARTRAARVLGAPALSARDRLAESDR